MTTVELLASGEATPDNPRWHELRRAGVTASEIAAVMGLSKWNSPFSLYWQKVNGWATEDNEIMAAGRHLEATIADWWAAENADALGDPPLMRAGLYAHPERTWQLATPDRKARFRLAGRMVTHGILECKWVAYSWDGWGEPGTDEVPVAYRCQALWQLDVMGVNEVHVAALGPGGFRSYLVRRDEADLKLMREAGEDFVRRLTEGDPPPLDSHTATLGALKRLHPEVGEGPVEVNPKLAEDYREARAARANAEGWVAAVEAQIRSALGSQYQRAVSNGLLVASRSIFETRRIDSSRLREEKPEIAAAYTTTTTVDKLTPGRAKP
jgi:putative phage-type endonuclease